MKFSIRESKNAKELVSGWSVRELLNGVCCPAFTRVGPDCPEGFGAMFFHPMKEKELEAHISSFKAKCQVPPFIVSDLEYGAGSMVLGATKFTSMMGISQTGSEELAYEVGAIAASEAGRLGYNWTFSPVADLAHNPDSPVVSHRSAGKDPVHAKRIVSAYMRGLQENGMMATIKHFPGDGYGSYDEHLTTPVNPLSQEEWREGPGRIFRELIDEGAMAVMPGHISLPAFDVEDEETGFCPPATVSRRLMVDLLRGELGFEGLIVTDALEMGGLVGYMNYFDACALALENGCDMLLFPRMDDVFYRELTKRVESGMLSLDSLRDRAARIVALKEQLGLLEEGASLIGGHAVTQPDYEKNRQIAEEVAKRSMTIVRDRKGIIPFKASADTRVLHVANMNGHERYTELFERMKTELERYAGSVEQWIDPGPDRLYRAMVDNSFDLVVCSIGSRLSYGLNVVRLHDEIARNMMGGWTKMGTPIVFAAHFHPFVHKEYEMSIDTIVNTYGDIECSARLLAEGIFGDRELNRKLMAHD